MRQKPGKGDGTCHVCGTPLDAGFCWKCGGDQPQAPKPATVPKELERVATPEENRAGLAAMRAAIYGKPGPMAETMDRVTGKLYGTIKRGEASDAKRKR